MPLRAFLSQCLNVRYLNKKQLLVVSLVCAVVAVAWLYTFSQYQAVKHQLSEHKSLVAESASILTRFTDQEIRLLEYLLSGDRSSLASYERTKLDLLASIQSAKALTSREPLIQHQRIASIEQMYRRWLKDFAQYAVGVQKDSDLTAAEKSSYVSKLLLQHTGKRHADRMTLLLNEYLKSERMKIEILEGNKSALMGLMVLLCVSFLLILGVAVIYILWQCKHDYTAFYGKLLAAIEQVYLGNYGYHLDTERNPEFQLITKAFNKMSDQLSVLDNAQTGLMNWNYLDRMSHEIRTALNGITGALEIMKVDKVDDEVCETMSLIEEGAGVLVRIVNDVLDLSKIEAGQLELDFQTMNLKNCVESIFRLSKVEARDMSVSLELEYDRDLPLYIYSDEKRIKQILINLINNAVKFTERGSVKLAVKKHNQTTEHEECVRFEVIDTGIGIEPNQISSIFDLVGSEDRSGEYHYGSSGFGLKLCHNLIKLMSGNIDIESERNKGTRVYFDLPLIQGTLNVPEMNTHEIEKGRFQGKKALVVEDNGINRIVAGAILEDLGFHVTFAINGQEGVNAAASERYDAIFMDMQMPIMDGIQATSIILQRDSDAPPIIGLTANVMDDDIHQCIDAGMVTVITKPLSIGKLYGVLVTVDI